MELHWIVIMVLSSTVLVGFFSSIKKKSYTWDKIQEGIDQIFRSEFNWFQKTIKLFFLYITIKRTKPGKVDLTGIALTISMYVPGVWDFVLKFIDCIGKR